MVRSRFVITLTALFAMLFVSVAPDPAFVQAASHREAPLIAMDAEADITDFFMFRSYEVGHEDNIVLIMDVIPGEEPSSGPNYWNFDPNVRYSFYIDNDADGEADDVRFDFQFTTEFRGVNKDLGLPLSYVAVPPITALDGAGSEGLGLRQKYSVTMVRDGDRDKLAEGLIAVPSNVGPRTMPDYEALAAQGIYELDDGVRVFAGQRQDPFYIDLGAIFDTLNLRRTPLPLLTAAEDADDTTNPFGVDMLSGFNVHTIALEVPASWLTDDEEGPDDTDDPVLGAYAGTSRRRVTVLRSSGSGVDAAFINEAALDAESAEEESADAASPDQQTARSYLPLVQNPEESQASTDVNAAAADAADAAKGKLIRTSGKYIQVQRLANPLINEVIIGTLDKDYWNALDPDEESRFLDYYLNPRLAVALELVYGVPAAKTDRQDLVDLLLKYDPSDEDLSELLRLNISVPPTLLADQKRLTVLAGDNAGWPNGRRPKDDVTDVAVRVVGGANYIAGLAGDGVNVDDAPLPDTFPFLATPFDGVTRVHQNP